MRLFKQYEGERELVEIKLCDSPSCSRFHKRFLIIGDRESSYHPAAILVKWPTGKERTYVGGVNYCSCFSCKRHVLPDLFEEKSPT